MAHYISDTDAQYDAVDYAGMIRKKLDPLGLSPVDPAYRIAARVMRGGRSICTVDSYGNEIRYFLRWCLDLKLDPLGITEDDMDMFITHIGNYAPRTQKLKLLVAHIFYAKAMRQGLATMNPVVIPNDLKRTGYAGKTPALTRTQVAILLASIRAEFDDPRIGLTAKRDYAMIMVMVRLFVRSAETLSLRWDRFVESDGRRFITFTGKGRKEGRLVVPDDVWEVLQSWRHAFEAYVGRPMAPADPLFVAVAARELNTAKAREGDSPLPRLCRGSLNRVVTQRINAIDIVGPRYGPHCLRATGAVLAYRAGASPLQICAALRHASLTTTMLYLESIMGTESASAIDSVSLDVPEWIE